MKESSCQFGEQGRLCGILTVPERYPAPRATLILVSAGLTAKTGPYRLYTHIARQLAASGIATLRFDLGGIGNSVQAEFGLPLHQRTQADIRTAVNFAQATLGTRTLLLGGLCSGAEDAFRYAEVDPRINGVVMLDPHAFRTLGWWLHHLTSLRSLRTAIKNTVRNSGSSWPLAAMSAGSRESDGSLIDYRYMRQAEARRIVATLLARGVRVHYMFTADRAHQFNHAAQLQQMLPEAAGNPRLSVSYLPHLEHTQFLAEDRQTVIDHIRDWISNSQPQDVPEPDCNAALAAPR